MKIRAVLKSSFITLSLGLMFVMGAHAKTPPEILEPYKAYRAALAEQNMDMARKHAQAAYEAGLDTLQAQDAMIGVLAQNLADIEEDPERRVELYKAAILATPTQTSDGLATAAQRWVLLSQVRMMQPSFSRKQFKEARKDIEAGWEFMESNDLTHTTFGAEIMVANGWVAAGRGREEEALEWYDRADAVFSSPNHKYFSVLEYSNKILRGKTLLAFDRDIEAALSLQEVMQNSEGKLPADHPYVKEAFHSWNWARSKIETSGKVEYAEEAGVCKCWPYDEISAKSPVALVRVPPRMPSYAKRSGRVLVKFDLSEAGKPENVQVLGYTEKGFVAPTLKSIDKWVYEISDELAPEDRMGITTTITFRLASSTGKIIPEKPLVMVADKAL